METLDLGSEAVEYIGWKAQKEIWEVDGESCQIKKLLIDPTTIKQGQGKLAQGQAPIWIWDEAPGVRSETKEGFKRAFCISVYLSEKYGATKTGWRDWMTNQSASKNALSAIWKDIGPKIKDNKGKVAVIEINGSKPQAIGENRVNVPILKMVGWTDRPVINKPEPEPELKDDIPSFKEDSLQF